MLSSRPIHYIVWRFTLGGAELIVQQYAKAFGEQQELFAYSIRKPTHEIFDGMQIETAIGEDSNWRCYWMYFQYCRKYRSHVFHLNNPGPIITFLTLIAGVKQPICHLHGTIYWHTTLQKRFRKFFWSLVAWFKVKYLAVSKHGAQMFTQNVLPEQPSIIYNGIQTEAFLARSHRRVTLNKIGYAGRLYEGKNVDLIIRLFAEVAANYPELELHIAGDGPLRPELEKQAAETAYADRIKFLGFISDMPSFYSSIDAFVFLSAYESFGNVLVEALLTGAPVLTSEVPVFKEIYGEEEDFILGDFRDYETVSRNFRDRLANYSQLAEKGYAMIETIQDQFSIEKHLSQVKRIYEHY